MKLFIGFIIASAALVCVNSDTEAEQLAWISKTFTEYMNLSQADIISRTEHNINFINTKLTDVSDEYIKGDLYVVFQFQSEIRYFLSTEWPKAYEALKKVDEKYRKTIQIKLGFAMDLIKWIVESESTNRKNKPLNVTDTEEHYSKKFKDCSEKLLTFYRNAIESGKKYTDVENVFFNQFHQKEYEFLDQILKMFAFNVKLLPTSAIRAKNLLELTTDLSAFLDESSAVMKLVSGSH